MSFCISCEMCEIIRNKISEQSTFFSEAISSPVNTLVLNPGSYRFADFVRVGVPFTLLVLLLAVGLIPLLFPF